MTLFTREFNGGGSCENENHIGMYGMQAAQLQHDKRKESSSRQNGNQEVLQILQEAYAAQGDEIILRQRKG